MALRDFGILQNFANFFASLLQFSIIMAFPKKKVSNSLNVTTCNPPASHHLDTMATSMYLILCEAHLLANVLGLCFMPPPIAIQKIICKIVHHQTHHTCHVTVCLPGAQGPNPNGGEWEDREMSLTGILSCRLCTEGGEFPKHIHPPSSKISVFLFHFQTMWHIVDLQDKISHHAAGYKLNSSIEIAKFNAATYLLLHVVSLLFLWMWGSQGCHLHQLGWVWFWRAAEKVIIGVAYIPVKLAGIFNTLGMKTHLLIHSNTMLCLFNLTLSETLMPWMEKTWVNLHKQTCVMCIECKQGGH